MNRELLIEVHKTLKEVKNQLKMAPPDPKDLFQFTVVFMKVEAVLCKVEAEVAKLPIAEHYPLKRGYAPEGDYLKEELEEDMGFKADCAEYKKGRRGEDDELCGEIRDRGDI